MHPVVKSGKIAVSLEGHVEDTPRPKNDASPSATMANVLRRWVKEQHANPKLLQEWLSGYGLPSLSRGMDDEPYLWLLRGLKKFPEATQPLTDAVESLLFSTDELPTTTPPNRYDYNVIMLAEALRTPERFQSGLLAFAERIPGEARYRGISLRKILPASVSSQLLPVADKQPPFPVPVPDGKDPCLNYLKLLDSKKLTREKLAAWLNGDLPFDNTAPYAGREPYVRLIGCLPLGALLYARQQTLSKAAATLLRKADKSASYRKNQPLMHNLLLLCKELRMPDTLCQPLLSLMNRRNLTPTTRTDLRSAILNNQRDNSLKHVWLDMLEGKKSSILPADTNAALNAVRLMPQSLKKPDWPDIRALGTGLRLLGTTLEKQGDRCQVFQNQLTRIRHTYCDLPLDRSLIKTADATEWMPWQVKCLNLFVPLTGMRYFVWEETARSLASTCDYAVHEKLCNDTVWEIRFKDKESRDDFCFFAPFFERARLSNPFVTKRAERGVVAQELTEAELQMRHYDPKTADKILRLREDCLRFLNVIPSKKDSEQIGRNLQVMLRLVSNVPEKWLLPRLIIQVPIDTTLRVRNLVAT